MYVASQRGSRCWRKTLARYGEAGPKRALCVEAGTKARLFRVQTLNRRYDLAAMLQRLATAALQTPPMPYRLLKLAEVAA